jgi:demethylphylloquinol methyltransferase
MPAAPAPADVQTLFNRIAPVYDQLNDRLSLGQHRVWKQMTVKWSQAQPGDQCLDLCCGSGDIALRLAEAVGPQGSVIGYDFAEAQLEIAQQRTVGLATRATRRGEAPLPQITWQQGDALVLPYADHSFDAITMGYGLRNVGNIPQCLQEIHRVLKPGKRAAILDFHRPDHPVFQALQQFYLQNIVVPTAKDLGLTAEYEYIMPSLDRFPSGQEQEQLGLAAGFQNATHYMIMLQMMGVLVLGK